MSRQFAFWSSLYLVFVLTDFLTTHGVIQSVSTRVGMSIAGFDYAVYGYTLFLGVTPLFYQRVALMSYGSGFLFMLVSMAIGILFIWLIFGIANYSSEMGGYEFVSAGLWFGFVNLALMCFIRVRKSMKQTHQ